MQTAIHQTLPDDWREYFDDGDVALELSDKSARDLYSHGYAKEIGEDPPATPQLIGLTPREAGRVAHRLYNRTNARFIHGVSNIESSLRNAIQLQTMKGNASATGNTIVSTARNGFIASGWPRSVVDAALIKAALHC